MRTVESVNQYFITAMLDLYDDADLEDDEFISEVDSLCRNVKVLLRGVK
jgi:hypothetical protein